MALCHTLCATLAWAQAPPALPAPAGVPQENGPAAATAEDEPPLPGLTRLSPEGDVWVDARLRRVVLRGKVVLREGPLELFACLAGTKEHEAIVAIRTKAQVVHAALLAVGAEAGGAVQFTPEYRPAQGSVIDIEVAWTDPLGKLRTARAADWIRNRRTERALEVPWVFGGSSFWEHPESKERFYLAEDGDLICVANFASATLDLPIASSQANDDLMFEAWTDRIPPVDTPVVITLVPRRTASPAPRAPANRPRPRGRRAQ